MMRREREGGFGAAVGAGAGGERVNVPFCLGVVLLCLTLVSVHLAGGLFARYTATSSGSDSARVANMSSTVVFIVDGDNEEVSKTSEILIQPGENANITVKVRNFEGDATSATAQDVCEVALACTVSARNVTGNLPLTLSLKAGDGSGNASEATGTSPVSIGDGNIAFQAGVASEQTFTLEINWPAVNNDSKLAFEIDALEITVNTEQVD